MAVDVDDVVVAVVAIFSVFFLFPGTFMKTKFQ